MKKSVIIGVIFIIAVILLIFFENCSYLNCTPMKSWAIRGYCMCEDVSIICTPAGKSPDEYSFGKYIGPIPECCGGLNRIEVRVLENGNCVIPDDAGTICSDCGNNVCEEWENICNCAEDCE